MAVSHATRAAMSPCSDKLQADSDAALGEQLACSTLSQAHPHPRTPPRPPLLVVKLAPPAYQSLHRCA